MLVTRLAATAALLASVHGLAACGDDEKKNDRDIAHADAGDDGSNDAPDPDDTGLRGLDGGVGRDDGDAGTADADAAQVTCEVLDPQLGCGVAHGDFVRFDDKGVAVDRQTGLGWVAVELTDAELRNRDPDDALESKCRTLSVPGLGKLRIPEIEDVRTLAAGCDATEGAGSCEVRTDRAPQEAANGCACPDAAARGPHPSGGFCRVDAPTCETLWATTFCDPHSCPSHTHWFYDTRTGAVVLGDYRSEIARRARFYCVTEAEPAQATAT